MLTRIKFGWTSNGPLRINTCHTSYLSPFTVAAPQQKGISLHSYTRTIWNMLIGSIHQANASTRHHPHSLFLDSVRQPHHQRHCSSRLNKPTKYYRRFILDAWVFYLAASFEWDKPPASTVCLSPSAVSLSLICKHPPLTEWPPRLPPTKQCWEIMTEIGCTQRIFTNIKIAIY